MRWNLKAGNVQASPCQTATKFLATSSPVDSGDSSRTLTSLVYSGGITKMKAVKPKGGSGDTSLDQKAAKPKAGIVKAGSHQTAAKFLASSFVNCRDSYPAHS